MEDKKPISYQQATCFLSNSMLRDLPWKGECLNNDAEVVLKEKLESM